jgi:formylglycine-generating enzyme required for sulfatase activity
MNMKKKLAFFGLTVFLLVISGCPDVNESTTATVPVVVDAYSLDSLAIFPVADGTPSTDLIDTTQYTGTIVWKESDGNTEVNGTFVLGIQYIAEITLTAKAGYTFDGVPADSFTYAGAVVSNAANSGVVTITFPEIVLIVSDYSLDSLVTLPTGGGDPDPGPIDTTQYTGTIAWKESDGNTEVNGTFVTETQYIAEITLAAQAGYTFNGVPADSFTYTGALVSHEANSGVVTITFPPADLTVVTALDLSALVTAPVKYENPDTTAINETQYSGTIEWTGQVIGWVTDTPPRPVYKDEPYNDRPFKPATVFKAVVTLTAKTGFTFVCLKADSFTHNGASSVTNAVDSGTVTITFPVTGTVEENKMISVPGGTVGTDIGTWASTTNSPLPQIIASYKIGAYELTYNIWYEVYQYALQHEYAFIGNAREGLGGTTGAAPSGSSGQPAAKMRWLDAVVWCNAYSEKTGKTPVYKIDENILKISSTAVTVANITADANADGFRLPTEAEWEYASRGGIPSNEVPWTYSASGSNDVNMVAWHSGNSGGATHEVGTAAIPNTLGIYDMTGNVWEWIWTNSEVMGASRSAGGAYQAVSLPSTSEPDADDIGFRVVCK